MLSRLLPTATTIAALVAVAGCSGGSAPSAPTYGGAAATSPSSPATSATEDTSEAAPDPAGTVIDISIKGDSVSPSGQRVEADLDEPVILEITSDRAGEFHVHSTPEQVVPFSKGTSTVELTFEQAGVVDVEEHESGKILVQLQVS